MPEMPSACTKSYTAPRDEAGGGVGRRGRRGEAKEAVAEAEAEMAVVVAGGLTAA